LLARYFFKVRKFIDELALEITTREIEA